MAPTDILEKASELFIPTSNLATGASFSGEGLAAAGAVEGATGGAVVDLVTRLPDCAVAMKVKLNSNAAAKSEARIWKYLDCFITVSIVGNNYRRGVSAL